MIGQVAMGLAYAWPDGCQPAFALTLAALEGLLDASAWLWVSLLALIAVAVVTGAMRSRQRLMEAVAQLQRRAAARHDGKEPEPLTEGLPEELRALAATIDRLGIDRREKEAFERQMIRGQKMEMLGILANCIAHDFNNLLGAITSALDLIDQEVTAKRNPAEIDWRVIENALETLNRCASRGRDTVNQMLSFARADLDDRRLFDLNDVVRATRQMCTYSIDKRIAVAVEQSPTPAPVTGNPAQLEQALLNLCLNAQDAMPQGGTIRLTLAEVTGIGDAGGLPADLALPAWRLTVSDTGHGVDDQDLPRLFNPFFTTREHGTGLGLVIVRRIVEAHGGAVTVASQRGVGTTFTLYLPRGQGELKTLTPAAAEPDLRYATDHEGILLVDDEEAIRRLNIAMLERLGYRVVEATNGQEAIARYRDNPAAFSLVILDLILPDLAGDDVYNQLLAIDPAVKVLVISGFNDDPRVADMIVKGCQGFLKKPYSLAELSGAFRAILDG